jgi:hypothetical protein
MLLLAIIGLQKAVASSTVVTTWYNLTTNWNRSSFDTASGLLSLVGNMCKFQTRVHSCGHYEKTLLQPCEDAKKAEEPCSSGSEDSKTTGGLCYISGCDKKPGLCREGPGKLILLPDIMAVSKIFVLIPQQVIEKMVVSMKAILIGVHSNVKASSANIKECGDYTLYRGTQGRILNSSA